MTESWTLAGFAREIGPALFTATGQTLFMVALSTVLAVLFGLPLGVALTVTDPNGVLPSPRVGRVLGAVVNTVRSVPFIILLVALIPVTRAILGTSIGSGAAVVGLTVAATPFLARLVESNLREVDRGVIEMALSMGATPMQVVTRVLLPEALPGLVSSLTVLVVNLIAYSAMAGAVGGGGLGQLAINYGYYRFRSDVMLTTVILLIIIVQLLQYAGDRASRALTKK
ncbi:MAG TPA: methionine ABC transporter permease [Symbiobacteriaceae bacterium]|jgi:D-methionine transport system permease protein